MSALPYTRASGLRGSLGCDTVRDRISHLIHTWCGSSRRARGTSPCIPAARGPKRWELSLGPLLFAGMSRVAGRVYIYMNIAKLVHDARTVL